LICAPGHSEALQCINLTGLNAHINVSKHEKVQKKAENYAKAKQNSYTAKSLRRRFYRSMTNLLLRRNLGTNRLSQESTRDVYNETVTKVKALLGQTLITDSEIVKMREELDKQELKIDELNQKLKVTSDEASQFEADLVTVQKRNSLVVLSSAEERTRLSTERGLLDALSVNREKADKLIEELNLLKEKFQADRDKLSERVSLKRELVKDIIADIKSYGSLPKKIKLLIDQIKVRGLRIEILSSVTSLTSERVDLPEVVDGKIIWKTAQYDSASALTEVSFLKAQVAKKALRKEIKKMLSEQAEVYQRLVIYKDYFLDAQAHNPSDFGLPKQKILAALVKALENKRNFPGYAALVAFERKIFTEEFRETFNIAEGAEPQTAILAKLSEHGGAVVSDFQEGIGAVKNSVYKQVKSAAAALLISIATTGGLSFAVPEGTGSVMSGVIGSGVEVLSEQSSRLLFVIENQAGLKLTAHKLSKVPQAEQNAWIEAFVELNGIDVTTAEGASTVRAIISDARGFQLGREQAQAEKAAVEKEKQDAVRELLTELE